MNSIKFYLLLISLTLFNEGFSQVNNYYLKPTQSLKITSSNTDKISVFIFQKRADTSLMSLELNESLNYAQLDFSNFIIHRIYTSQIEACSKDSLFLILDDIEFLPHPYFDGYLILVNPYNPKFKKLFEERISKKEADKFTNEFKNSNYKFSFLRFNNYLSLLKFISIQNDTNTYVTHNEFYKTIYQNNYNNNLKLQRTDSIIKSISVEKKKHSNLLLKISPSVLNNGQAKHLKLSNTNINRLTTNNIKCNFNSFKTNKNTAFGYGLGIGISQFKGIASNAPGFNPIIDTLDYTFYNSKLERYTLIAKGNNITEEFKLTILGYSVSASIQHNFKLNKIYALINFNCGIQYSHFINSTYKATGGYFQIDTLIYSNNGIKYAPGQLTVFNSNLNTLRLNNRFVSGIFDIDLALSQNKLKRVYFDIGLNLGLGNNIILLPQSNEKAFSKNTQKYNSLLYRSDYFRLNFHGLHIGLLIKI